MPADDLRARIAEALEPCEPFDLQLTDRVMVVLAADPGDLREQLIAEIRESLRQWDAMGIEGRPGVTLPDFLAASVMALPLLAAAEARLEHALDELSNLRDHRARWETEKARADKAEADLASLQALADRCREKDWAYAAERVAERDEARGLAAQYAQKAVENGQRAEAAEAQVAALQRELEATHVRAKTAVKRRNDVKTERDDALDRLRKAEGAYSRLDAERREADAARDRWKGNAEQAERRLASSEETKDAATFHLNMVTKDRLKWEQESLVQQRRAEQAERELAEFKRVTEPPAGDEEMPTDPAELREMWDFINRQTRWQYHMAHKFGGQVGGLRAELAEARAVWSDWRGRLGGSFPRAMVQELDAALDAPQRPEDAREPAPKMRPVSVESPGNDGFRYEPVTPPESPEDAREETGS